MFEVWLQSQLVPVCSDATSPYVSSPAFAAEPGFSSLFLLPPRIAQRTCGAGLSHLDPLQRPPTLPFVQPPRVFDASMCHRNWLAASAQRSFVR